MRAHVKLLFRRLAWPVRNPGARVHVGNAKSIDVMRAASKTVNSPLKENFVKPELCTAPESLTAD
jgi:hypothetical protein